MPFRVLIPQDITRPGKQYLEENGCEIKVLQDCSVENICREVKEMDAILMRTAPCPSVVFEAADRLKVVARHGAGFDNIDLEAATAHHVQVCNTPTANSNSVAEHTMSLLLACAKNLLIHDRACRKGDFESRNRTLSVEVEGKVLGLVGCGHIGQLVAKKAALGLGMRVIGYDAYAKPENMPEYITLALNIEEVYQQADFLSLHVPLTPDTKGMIDRHVFTRMKPNAIVLNCARGGIVNEGDLYWAISNNIISGAGLDVFSCEPIDPSNPLYSLDKVVVTPHSAAQTFEATDRMGLYAAQSIIEVLQGKPPRWPVNHLG